MIQGQNRHKVIWFADFNVKFTVGGGSHTDPNGKVIEDLIEERDLACMNNGRGTRVNIITRTK